jgi:hypothetical protein
MSRTLGAAVLMSTLALTGCFELPSLHALYTAEDHVLDPALEGRWENNDAQLVVEREGDFYTATWTWMAGVVEEPSVPINITARLLDLGGVRLADVFVGAHGIGHHCFHVQVTDGELHLESFDSKWLLQRISHAEADLDNGKTMAVLITRTSSLRKLVGRWARDPQAFDARNELIFRRSP